MFKTQFFIMKKLITILTIFSVCGISNQANAQKVIKKISDDVCDCVEELVRNNEVDSSTGVDELMEKCMLISFEKFEKELRKQFGDDFYDNPNEDAIYNLGIEVGKLLISDCGIFLEMLMENEQNSGSNAADFFERGEAFYAENKYKEAINEYNKALEVEPDNAEYYNSRGVAYYGLERYYYAISDFINAIRLKSNYAMAYYNLAQCKNNLQDYDSGLDDVKNSILYNPEFCSAFNLKGLLYNNLEEADSAYLAFEEAYQCNPEIPLYSYNMGYMQYSSGNYQNAINHFEEAVEQGYESASIYSYLGNSLDQLDKYTEAIKAHGKYIEAFQDDYVGYYNRGLAYYHDGDYKNAITDFLSASTISDSDADIFLKLAQSYDKAGMQIEAAEYFNKLIEMEPENAEYFDARAAFYAKNGEYERAISDSKRSLELYPNDCQVHMLMSRWYQALGDSTHSELSRKTGVEMGCEE